MLHKNAKKHSTTKELKSLAHAAYISYSSAADKTIKSNVFKEWWNILSSKDKTLDDFKKQYSPQLAEFKKSELTKTLKERKILVLSKIGLLYYITNILDLCDHVIRKNNRYTSFKKETRIEKQKTLSKINAISKAIPDDADYIQNKIKRYHHSFKEKIASFKVELTTRADIQEKFHSFESQCNKKMADYKSHFSRQQNQYSELLNHLKNTTDIESSQRLKKQLETQIKNLQQQIKGTNLPDIPDLKHIFNRPDFSIHLKEISTEINNFNLDYSNKIHQSKIEFKKIQQHFIKIEKTLILSQQNSLLLSDFFSLIAQSDLLKLQEEIIDEINDQYFLSSVEWETLKEFVINLFSYLMKYEPQSVLNLIKDIHNPPLDSKEETSAATFEERFNSAEKIFQEQQQAMQKNYCDLLDFLEGNKLKRNTEAKTLGAKAELDKLENDIVTQLHRLKIQKEAEKIQLAQECEIFLKKINDIDVHQYISQNQQALAKQAEIKATKERAATQLVSDIKKRTSTKIALEDKQINCWELPQKARDYKIPSYKPMLGWSLFNGTLGLGLAGTSVATLAWGFTAGFIASSPFGWGLGFALAAAMLLISASVCAAKAYQRYKEYRDLQKHPAEAKFLSGQNEVLKEHGYHSSMRHLIIRHSIKLSSHAHGDEIACQMTNDTQHSRPPLPLFFKTSGELYTKHSLHTGFEKNFIKEDKDIENLYRKFG